jgi:hypothetical protein
LLLNGRITVGCQGGQQHQGRQQWHQQRRRKGSSVNATYDSETVAESDSGRKQGHMDENAEFEATRLSDDKGQMWQTAVCGS